ncbi:MAG: GMC oxidoreductase [Candidatus Marivariicella sp.]
MKENNTNHFEAIVIGAGMTGGWAAKELCDNGVDTLLIERGRNVEHIKDYPTSNMLPWEFKHRGQINQNTLKENPVVSRCYNFNEDSEHFFAKDKDHPYSQEKPFDWIRGYQVGGKSIIWGRKVQRWSNYDFEGPIRDGFAVDWPIRYKDLANWYSKVEHFIGVSGNKDGLDVLPDGDFLKTWPLNCVEEYFQNFVKSEYKDRFLIHARCAHITENRPIFVKQGRGLCLSRNICQRGCPYGGYFNANSTLIPWALKTGNLKLKSDSIVHSILFDEGKNKAVGVKIIDANTFETKEYYAKFIFLCASTLNSNYILLNSKSIRFPRGLGNDHDILGKFVSFHNYRGKIKAIYEGQINNRYKGNKPTSCYIPRFRNVYNQETNFLRGYAASFSAKKNKLINTEGFGNKLRENLLSEDKKEIWQVSSHMMGETIPKKSNFVNLSDNQKDKMGMPILKINVDYDNNDELMLQDFFEQFYDMYSKAGFKNIEIADTEQAPGLDIHEMGGVRMGNDPHTSMLDKWNRLHKCKNVFVTDGSCMTSTGTQNPSLTFMAITARAANHAIKLLKRGDL